MARIRTVKPELFKNEELAELPVVARLLFIGLFCLADKEGRLLDRPKRIKAELYPYDSVDINDQLSRLQSAGFISRYEVGEMKVIQVVNFTKHQRITGSELGTESLLPPKGNTEETLRKHQGPQEGKGKEGNGMEGVEADKPPTPPATKEKFEKPTKETLINFFVEIGLDDFSAEAQAAKFLNHYDSNGWKVGGKTAMKDWKAAVRGWKDRMNNYQQSKNGAHQQTSSSRKSAGANELLSDLKNELGITG